MMSAFRWVWPKYLVVEILQTMTSPLKKLPADVLKNVREYASDCVKPHPTAALIQSLRFSPDVPALVDSRGVYYPHALIVHGENLTHRRCKCLDPLCWICFLPESSCTNAVERIVPTLLRRFSYYDFSLDTIDGWNHFTMWPGEYGPYNEAELEG